MKSGMNLRDSAQYPIHLHAVRRIAFLPEAVDIKCSNMLEGNDTPRLKYLMDVKDGLKAYIRLYGLYVSFA